MSLGLADSKARAFNFNIRLKLLKIITTEIQHFTWHRTSLGFTILGLVRQVQLALREYEVSDDLGKP